MFQGIVLPAGGLGYLASAWACVRILRWFGCPLPIECWYLDDSEFDPSFEKLATELGMNFRIASYEVLDENRPTHGWELKAYALVHSAFDQVILLDADNVPVRNPEFFFETPQFKKIGALFWPDRGRIAETNPIWDICGVEYRDEPEWESGQIVVDRTRCMEALELALEYNRNREVIYQHVHGDKETFHLAFRKTETPVAMPDKGVRHEHGVHFQHDFEGNLLFQHRSLAKWKLFGKNPRIPGFQFEEECLGYLDELREKWDFSFPDLTRYRADEASDDKQQAAEDLMNGEWCWRALTGGMRRFRFLENGLMEGGGEHPEVIWDLVPKGDGYTLRICREFGPPALLERVGPDVWRGMTRPEGGFPVKVGRV